MTQEQHPITPGDLQPCHKNRLIKMTELSTAARAVLHAAEKQTVLDYVYASNIAAAALRAVAEQVGPSEILPLGYTYSAPAEMWHYEFKLKAQRQILAIADELDPPSS